MQNDLTKQNVTKSILFFTLPIFLGNVFQQFYNMVDTIIVGQFVGTNALAGVGSTGTIMFLIFGLVSGMTLGFTVLTSQRYGANDLQGVHESIKSAVILNGIITLIMTIICIVFMKPLLHLMQTPMETFDYAYDYIIIISYGIVAQVAYNYLSCLLRGLGDSKTPLYFLVLSVGLNIILDYLLVAVIPLGTAGAAIATVISQLIAAIASFAYIMNKVKLLHFNWHHTVTNKDYMLRQLMVGIPMALQYSITAIGTTMIQVALNMLGPIYMAAYTSASKIEQLVTQAYGALGTTMATFAAQNIGANDIKRVKQGFKSAAIIGYIYGIVFGFLMAFYGKYFTSLFVSENVEVLMVYVDIYLKWCALFLIPLTIVNVYRNGIQGLGYGFMPMLAGIAELVGRGIVAIIGINIASYSFICLNGPFAWSFAAIVLLIVYHKIINDLAMQYKSNVTSK